MEISSREVRPQRFREALGTETAWPIQIAPQEETEKVMARNYKRDRLGRFAKTNSRRGGSVFRGAKIGAVALPAAYTTAAGVAFLAGAPLTAPTLGAAVLGFSGQAAIGAGLGAGAAGARRGLKAVRGRRIKG